MSNRYVHGPGAHVPAWACARLAPLLLDNLQRARRDGQRDLERIADVIQGIADAGRWAISDRGSVVAPIAEMAASSPSPDMEVTTAEASVRLHLTPRRIVQLLADGELPGRKIGGQWWLPIDALDKWKQDHQ